MIQYLHNLILLITGNIPPNNITYLYAVSSYTKAIQI